MRSLLEIGVLATFIAIAAASARAESVSTVKASAMQNPPARNSAAQDSEVRKTVAAVRGVFADKCSGCHGPDLVKPRGRFGYVLDLRRIAENPEMVSPSSPDESELWLLVKDNEMPPPDAPRGPLSDAQKNIIRTWIAEGARDFPAQPATEAPSGAQAESAAIAFESLPAAADRSAAPAPPVSNSIVPKEILWFGRFHLMAIHFPIALMIAAAIGEFWTVWTRSRIQSESTRFCLWLAAIAALPTATLGWLYAAAGNGAGSQLLPFHRWLGTATAACIIGAAICCELDHRRNKGSRLFRALVVAAVLLTVATAHIGGLLAHGADFFSW
jgi:uncharacterized membrane protein/mono/diheme cytochrome c family protein